MPLSHSKKLFLTLLLFFILARCDYRVSLGKGFEFVSCNSIENIIASDDGVVVFPDIISYRFDSKFIWGCTRKFPDEEGLWLSQEDYVYGYFFVDKLKNTVLQGMSKAEFKAIAADNALWSGFFGLPEEKCDSYLKDKDSFQGDSIAEQTEVLR